MDAVSRFPFYLSRDPGFNDQALKAPRSDFRREASDQMLNPGREDAPAGA
jgi:hypothetical protein